MELEQTMGAMGLLTYLIGGKFYVHSQISLRTYLIIISLSLITLRLLYKLHVNASLR